VVHLGGQTRKINHETYLEEVKGIFYLYRKHYRKLDTIGLKILMLYGGLLKVLLWIFLFINKKMSLWELRESLKLHWKMIKLSILYPLKPFHDKVVKM